MKFTAKEWVTLYTVVEQARGQASNDLKDLAADDGQDSESAKQYKQILHDHWKTLDSIMHKLDIEEV